MADEVQAAVAGTWGRPEAREITGQGAGGDGTVYVDRLAEDTALRILDEEHAGGREFDLISEEIGERRYGRGGDVVILDPIDGSVNAKMGIPFFSITMAAARGRHYGDVFEGMVRNLVTGDHHEARRGRGATLNGHPLRAMAADPEAPFPVIQVEPTRLRETFAAWLPLLDASDKVRMLGSAAINICLCSSGSVAISAAPTLRSVDCAGPLCILREAGGAFSDFAGGSIDEVEMGLETRTSVLAASDPHTLGRALKLMAPLWALDESRRVVLRHDGSSVTR
ncbi:MAG: inositol monophosphatase family protein [Candidatus Dormibacteria bacterium]